MLSFFDISHLFRRKLRKPLLLLVALCSPWFLMTHTRHLNREDPDDILSPQLKLPPRTAREATKWDAAMTLRFWNIFTFSHADQATVVSERLLEKISRRLRSARAYANRTAVRWNQSNAQTLVITRNGFPGRLGNFMFEMASLLGIAHASGRIPVMQKKDEREEFFEGLRLPAVNLTNISIAHESEEKSGTYSARMANLKEVVDKKEVVIHGYYQSWKYFSNISDRVRQAFTLDVKVQIKALGIIMRAMDTVDKKRARRVSPSGQITLIGVHVRRLDYLHRLWLDGGSVRVPESYFLGAIDRYRKSYQRPVFIVLSDDVDYCKKVFRGDDFYMVTDGLARVHLAVLTLMDSVIISIGSFGWWGAYLSEAADVTYFRDWPRNNTILGDAISHKDYFPPEWHGAA